MSMLSIPSYKTDDPNYRYKMPRLVAKVEGRGNGIKTNIVNMGDIAKALKRPPDYPTRFCAVELCTNGKFDPQEGKAIVNGAHEQQALQNIIDKFIDKFVLCENCKLPEIDLQLSKKGLVIYHCNACGHKGDSDNAHRLAAFILKNPPDGGDSTMGAKSKKDKKEKKRKEDDEEEGGKKKKSKGSSDDGEEKKKKKKKKSSKSKAAADSDDEDDEGDEDEEAGEKKKSKKAKKSKSHSDDDEADEDGGDGAEKKKSKKSSKKSSKNVDEALDDDEDATAGDDKKKKKKKSKSGTSTLDGFDDEKLEYTSQEISDIVTHLIRVLSGREAGDDDDESENKKVDVLSLDEKVTPQKFADEVLFQQQSQGLDQSMKMFIALDSLFSTNIGGLGASTLNHRVPFLKPVCKTMSTKDVLIGLQDFVHLRSGTSVPNGFKTYSAILQKLYDQDILSQNGIIDYYTRGTRKSESFSLAKEAATEFIQWLEDSDDSGDDEEEEEEGGVPVTVATKKLGTVEALKSNGNSNNNTADDDDSDIDIDDI